MKEAVIELDSTLQDAAVDDAGEDVDADEGEGVQSSFPATIHVDLPCPQRVCP